MRRLLWFVAIALLAASAARRPSATSETRTAVGSAGTRCDPSYPTLCIPVGVPDLDCAEVGASSFPVRGPDRHGFDADHDGIGCEPWKRGPKR